jgi:hypothetical protein
VYKRVVLGGHWVVVWGLVTGLKWIGIDMAVLSHCDGKGFICLCGGIRVHKKQSIPKSDLVGWFYACQK